jgi:phenylalanyl-tRNA synthetase beta chain
MNRLHELEQRTLEYLSSSHAFHEIHGYLWYDSDWLNKLGYEPGPCIELANPAAEGQDRMRQSLMPGLLAAVAKNRFYFPSLALMELGSVFVPDRVQGSEHGQSTTAPDREQLTNNSHEFRHFALVLAQRGKDLESDLDGKLRAAISGWAWNRFGRQVAFAEVDANRTRPWEHRHRTANVMIDSLGAGRLSLVDQPLRRRMDEHLVPWAIVWAELWLTQLAPLARKTEKRGTIPPYPVVELDFSLLVPRTTRYSDVAARLQELAHPMLRQVSFVTSYEGKSVASDKRSLTFRMVIGDATRTLTDDDAEQFRAAIERHLQSAGFELRKG